jgi:hypothetical protein
MPWIWRSSSTRESCLASAFISRASLRDLLVEIGEQAQEAIEPPPPVLAQLEPREERPARLAEQVGVGVLAMLCEQRMDAVLERGAQLGQDHALAQEVAQVAQLRGTT